MGSINAQKVAQKVQERIKKGQKVVLKEIIREAGYSEATSERPSSVTDLQSYKKAMEVERLPIIAGLQEEIARIKLAMARRNLDKEEYRVLTYSLDTLTKNYQLLSGGATERQVFVLPSEIMAKNLITIESANSLPLEGSKLTLDARKEPNATEVTQDKPIEDTQ